MTLPELHTQIRTQFEAVAAQTLDNFLPQEIDLYINRGIREFIGQHRPALLPPRESAQTREALENLRDVVYSHSYTSAKFDDISEMEGAWSLPIPDLDPTYEYFISGRLNTDQDTYNVETTTIRDFYEHLETRHNTPLFRRPKIIERGEKFLIALPDPDETPNTLEMTYLGEFTRVDIKLVVEYTVSAGGGNDTSSIEIEGVSYDIPAQGSFDAQATVDNFISTHKSDIYSNHGVNTVDKGDTIAFVTFNDDITENDFGLNASSGTVALVQDTTTSRSSIPLPTTTHQEIANLTVGLMKRDLPQAQEPQRQRQAQSNEEQ